ncbi:steroid receptor RNA activator 1 [Harpegnathos saltator]|uniref:Steroid receptor RNA activator 1 n=1 Tax=Harpegnathos saltator TaxID=610380 RepID=E2B662_HARSA|nr:steroid receptor RNA activator 1 [Harpegnathos saltator]EFN88851.1 Steroid receptor RNA activator 1 [Harpegnathos saltator]
MEQIPPPAIETVSSQKSLPSSYDSGWNDPPEWAMSSQRGSSDGTSSKRLLNKRVAFPLSSQTSTSEKTSPSLPSNMPPILLSSLKTALHKPLVTPNSKDIMTKPLESDFDKNQALTEVMANLESVMNEQKMEKNKLEEIQKRLDIMKSDWLEDKLNDTIQKSVLDVSKALLRRDVQQADQIHINLMMQHATICRTWISAIRHVILELKKEDEDLHVKRSHSPLLSVERTEKK